MLTKKPREFTRFYGNVHEEHERRILICEKQELYDLIYKFEDCASGSPCRSAACVLCAKEFGDWLFDSLEEFLPLFPDPVAFTAVQSSMLTRRGELDSLTLDRITKSLQRGLRRAGLHRVPLFATLDVSLERQRLDLGGPAWQPHHHGSAFGISSGELKARLNAVFPGSIITPVPNHARRAYDLPGWVAYTHKPHFNRNFLRKERGRLRFGKTPKFSQKEQAELFLFLDKFNINQRTYFQVFRRYGKKNEQIIKINKKI